MTGTEVERVERHGVTALENFVVGRVVQAEQHPNADRLTVCLVDIGNQDAPADRLRRAQRGRRADGRGGQARRGDARRQQAAQGQAARGRVQRDDPGRGRAGDRHRARRDHGARGGRRRARDARWPRCCRSPPTCWCSRSPPTGPTAWPSTASRARSMRPPARRCSRRRGRRSRHRRRRSRASRIDGRGPDLCPRFTARVFEDVKIGPSPPWLKARLMAAGQRPISNVVDITNYVMLLTGQPLHAFDLDRVAGRAAHRPPGAAPASRSRRSTGRPARSTRTWC